MGIQSQECRDCGQTTYKIDGKIVTKRDGTTFLQKWNEPQGINPHYLSCTGRQQQNQVGGYAGTGAQRPPYNNNNPTPPQQQPPVVNTKDIELQLAGIADQLKELKEDLGTIMSVLTTPQVASNITPTTAATTTEKREPYEYE